MVWDVLGEWLTLWFLGMGEEGASGQGQSLPSSACSSSKHKPLAGACLHEAGLGPSWSRLAQAVPGATQSIPLTDISKCTGFVCGRDLEEALHPGGHSDEALPALRLTLSAPNVLPLCCCTNLNCCRHPKSLSV